MQRQTRQFGGFRRDCRELAAWLAELHIELVVMESTGIYWKSVSAPFVRRHARYSTSTKTGIPGMSFSSATYRIVLNTAVGRQVRRCWEICECDINGKVQRDIARTPIIVGEGEKQAANLAKARAEAERMLRAFTTPVEQ